MNANTLTPIITKLLQLIIEHKKIPEYLKISCITPLYKKGEVHDFGNYRPVGSMCFIEKIIEKYIEGCTKKYIQENKIIPSFQYGFQPKKSTLTLLEEFSEVINTALDRRLYVVVLWLDLTRAFETIDHQTMLQKYHDIGIHNELFSDYFNNRTQVTKIGDTKSEEISIEDGLITGAITSPGSYNTYTYDIQHLDLKCQLMAFADDSSVVAVHKKLETAVQRAQDDFITLQKYFYNNNIFINQSKTEAMVMGVSKGMSEINLNKLKCHTRSCLYLEQYKTQCQCPFINYSDSCKYLGLNIDSKFKMIPHVNILCKKMRILNFRLRKGNVCMLPIHTKKLIYYSLVDSLLRYGVTIYTYSPTYVIDPLNNAQRRIIKYLFWKEQEAEFGKKLLNPNQLSKLILMLNNFNKEEYKVKKVTTYALRTQNLMRTVGNNQYGDRLKTAHLPKLFNKYCISFLNETSIPVVKELITKILQEEQAS